MSHLRSPTLVSASQASAPKVLWVYSDSGLELAMDNAVRGELSAGTVLGYPECCVARHAELEVSIAEAYTHGIFDQYEDDYLAEEPFCTYEPITANAVAFRALEGQG